MPQRIASSQPRRQSVIATVTDSNEKCAEDDGDHGRLS